VARSRNDILQGTLALLVSRPWPTAAACTATRSLRTSRRVSADLLRVEEGSLYPGLHRMAQEGWLRAEWGVTEKNRQARFYAITRAGRTQLQREEESWARLCSGVRRVLEYA